MLDVGRVAGVENFTRQIGEEFYRFNFTITYFSSGEVTLGPYGLDQPEGGMSASLELAATVFENHRYLPAKIKVTMWR